jgi:hypothetical protein
MITLDLCFYFFAKEIKKDLLIYFPFVMTNDDDDGAYHKLKFVSVAHL